MLLGVNISLPLRLTFFYLIYLAQSKQFENLPIFLLIFVFFQLQFFLLKIFHQPNKALSSIKAQPIHLLSFLVLYRLYHSSIFRMTFYKLE